MEEENSENTCDLCKISYASESELNDHVWSLMHHIKIEQRKKGSAHTCSLCLANCENIIEYGKHLNDDRHKHALSRRDQDNSDILDSFRQGDNFGRDTLDDTARQYERDVEFRQPNPVPNRKQSERSAWHNQRGSKSGHSRSFSEPQIETGFQQDYNNSGNRYFGGKPKNWKKKPKNKKFYQSPDFEFQDLESSAQWDQFDKDSGPDYWNQTHWVRPGYYSQFASQGLYTAFDDGTSPFNDVNAETKITWGQNKPKSFRNYNRSNSNRRGSFDSSFESHSRSYSELDKRGRGLTRGFSGRRGNANNSRRQESNDKSSPDSNSSNDSGGLKRRRDDDLEVGNGKLRKGNSNKRIGEMVRPLTPGSDFVPDSLENLIEDESNQRRHHLTERSSSRDRMAESLPVRMETSPSRRAVSPSPVRSLDRKQKQVTWASDMVSSTTDIDSEPQIENRKLRSPVVSKRSSSLDSAMRRNKLPDSTSDKKVEKKYVATKDIGKTKNKGKNKPAVHSPASQRKSPRKLKDEGESVLERAEKLCKKLRDEREKGKKEKEMKEKQKKLEKHKELNSQIKVLTEKNQAPIKGHLEAAENKIDKNMNNSGSSSEQPNLLASSRSMGVLEKAAVSLGIPIELNEGRKQPVSKDGSKTGVKSINSQPKLDIERIRENIETSVKTELSEKTGRSVSNITKPGTPKSDTSLSPPAFPSPLAKHMLSKQKSDSGSNYDTDHLLKMVNSPRSTKERLQIAQMLRTYAKSQTKLSLPRFNLKMSDLCSGSGDRQDDIAELNLEDMSPDLQLEIANLIEADIKPDITELEKILDFQSASNETLDMGVLSDLGILSPAKGGTPGRTTSPHMQIGSPVVTPSPFQKQFSCSESALSNFQSGLSHVKQATNFSDIDTRQKEEIGGQLLIPNIRSISPVRREIPDKETDDKRPSLSIEDLVTDLRGAKESLMGSSRMESSPTAKAKSVLSSEQSQAREIYTSSSPGRMSSSLNAAPVHSSSHSTDIKIKEEKMDFGYERLSENAAKADTDFEQFVRRNRFTNSKTEVHSSSLNLPKRSGSPVRQSLYSSSNINKNLDQNISDDMPVKDTERPESDKRTALEKVKSILDEAPNMERVLGYQHESAVQLPSKVVSGVQPVDHGLKEKDKLLDVSQGSQTSSILDQVYNISLQEENVRQELSTVDQKISQLQKLIDEATQQMSKFTEKKETLLKQEDHMRNTRMKLLQDSRSQSSVGSQPEALHHSALSHLTDAQLHNLSNPVFIKFLMSQRNQSDLSSVGGFSNVETGSQIEGEQNASRGGSRRGSFTSNITEPVSILADKLTPRQENDTRTGDEGTFLTQSVELLSGSAASVRTLQSDHVENRTGPVYDQVLRNTMKEMKEKDPVRTGIDTRASQLGTQTSFSFINTPLDKGGFVTLEELMNGNSDIGKLLQRSLECGDKLPVTEVEKSGAQTLSKDNDQLKPVNDFGRPVGERERRDSLMSAGSDDIVMSGSDIEKRSGKVSMKFMGTIPDGVKYSDFMKQLASDSKTKPVMYTVVTSPVAVSQLKKFSDSGLGTGSLSSQSVPQSTDEKHLTSEVKDAGYRSEGSNTTGTLTINELDFESQSVKSTYSLGEQIKRMCEGQNPENDNLQLQTPRSISEGEKTLEDDSKGGASVSNVGEIKAPQSPSRKMLQSEFNRHETSKGNKMLASGVTHDLPLTDSSPTRKKLKTKKERDRKSRRKQKEEFILESSSDTNSVEDEPHSSLKLKMGLRQPSVPEEDLVATGSEDQKTGDQSDPKVKKSLLDEVQLETETPSDSCEDRNKGQSQEDFQRLKVKPEVLESFRSVVKTKLQGGKNTKETTQSVQYKGPSLSVSAIQVFKEDVYVCYNGSELRRFNLKTGEILKELDCSPYLVQCLIVTSVEEREDILYTGGACKKLMLFKPQKFNLIETYDYDERITCLHENWGRLFVGLSDGVVSVRSLKTDKELNLFQTTNKSVQCLSSTSAGMTKMLCCGCSDKLIYVLDAISGLLLTMLQGHKLPPLCIEIFDDLVVSGAADKTVLVHNVRSGTQEASLSAHKAMVSQITSDKDSIYTSCYDKLVRCYSKKDLKLQRVYYGAGKGMLTTVIHQDGKLLTGNKEGLVESIPLLTSSSWACQCDGCKLEFPIREHLLHHVLTDHFVPNTCILQCPWSGCSHWLSTEDSLQKAEEHIITEHFK